MIVDDDAEIRESMVQALMMEDYSVITAVNGRNALDLLGSYDAANLPNCIIVDLTMPVMGGEQFLSEIKSSSSSHLSRIPIIIASAKGYGQLEIPGANGMLAKPLDLSDLYSVVESYCE